MKNVKSKRRTIIITAIVLGSSLASVDIIDSLPREPSIWSGFGKLIGPWATTAALCALGFAAGWWLLMKPLRRLLLLPEAPLLAAWGAFTLTAFALLSTQGLFRMEAFFQSSLSNTLIALALAAAIAVIAYLSFDRVSMSGLVRRFGWKLFLALPFALSIALAHRWALYHFYDAPDTAAWSYHDVVFLCALGLAFVLLTFSPTRITTTLLVVLFVGCVAAGARATAGFNGFDRAPYGRFTESRHKVPRVILISVDTLRADALSCYNASMLPTPNIDRLAADSVKFENAYSGGPWTLPGVASMLTGLPEFAHRMNKHKLDRIPALPLEITTLAEHMREAGYRTAAIAENPVLDANLNLYQGYLEYAHLPRFTGQSFGVAVLRNLFPRRYGVLGAPMVTDLARDWLNRNHARDFFLWVHYFDPHLPYNPPARFLPPGRSAAAARNISFGNNFNLVNIRSGYPLSAPERDWARQLYLAEVRYTDENIGALLDHLKRLGLYDDSLIVLTSDHGEEFWEHGGFEHGHALYNEVTSVPLIVKLPRSSVETTIPKPVSTRLITPAVLDICGLSRENRCYSPPSLAPLWSGAAVSPELDVVLTSGAEYYEDQEAVIAGNHKLIRYIVSKRAQLYDLATDAGEQVSILNSARDTAEQMGRLLDQKRRDFTKVRDCYSPARNEHPKLSPEQLQRLRALGYIQ